MKKKKEKKYPTIGISSTLLPIETGVFLGHQRVAVVHEYVQAIEAVEGVPIVLPVISHPDLMDRQMEMIDGLLLSGGYDVSPILYEQSPRPGMEYSSFARDIYEIEMIRRAYQQGKPILGICRGLQVLNVAFGGTLFQDIGREVRKASEHSQKAKPEDGFHIVNIKKETLLHRMLGKENLLTNSIHHQSIDRLGLQLQISGWAEDGVIEAIEGTSHHQFVVGLQWHPEMLLETYPENLNIFNAFVKAASH